MIDSLDVLDSDSRPLEVQAMRLLPLELSATAACLGIQVDDALPLIVDPCQLRFVQRLALAFALEAHAEETPTPKMARRIAAALRASSVAQLAQRIRATVASAAQASANDPERICASILECFRLELGVEAYHALQLCSFPPATSTP